MAFRGQYEHSLDSKDRLTVPARFRAALADGVVLSAGLDPCVEVYPTSEYARFEQQVLAELNPLSRHGRMMRRRFHGRSHDETLDSAGRIRIPSHLVEHAELEEGPCVVIGVADHLEIWNTRRWADHDAEIDATAAEIAEELAHGAPGTAAETGGAGAEMATLTYMPTEHVPVLASELIELLDPRPGETAVDCTFGGGGHARLVGERLGAGGTLVCIDRDPAARGAVRRSSRTSSSARPGSCGRTSPTPSSSCAARACAPTSSTWTWASRRSNSTPPSEASPTPTTRRSTCAWTPARSCRRRRSSTSGPQERLAGIIREYGEERHARAIAREIVRRRPLETTADLVEAIRAAVPPAYRFGRGHPAKRTFQAIRIAVNDELDSLDRALPAAWELLREGGRLAAISFHSLEDRRVKRFLADRARGCICPPELPVCRCGREPEAEPLTRRALAATPEEIERNPRSHSARLRVARKLHRGRGRR